MSGVRNFCIKSKFFQLMVEEGGRYFSLLFERSRYLMKLVFMGKNVAQWLMKSIEQIAVGINPKDFYKIREGDLAYTLQRSSNSVGLFLLLTEFKIGGSRRSIIIPEGRAKNGWRVFGLELRKTLELENYVNGGSGQSIFVAQLHKDNLGVQPFKTYADMVCGNQHPVIEQRMLSGTPVSIPGPTFLGGRDVGSRCINEEFNFGEKNPVGNKRRSLLKFNSNWNIHGYGKKRDFRKFDWTGVGLTIEVNGEGKRRVVWNSYKGGLRSSIWVKRNQREHVVGPSRGSWVHTNPVVYKGGLRSSKWVNQREHVGVPLVDHRITCILW